MKEIFTHDDTEAILLVDATNAFNVINCQAALHNIQVICPAISTILNNTYLELFIMGEGVIESSEGNTQGDPQAMAMYALAIKPLIDKLRDFEPDVKQVWFADDATAAGRLKALQQWWQHLTAIGPNFGYFPNATTLHTHNGSLNIVNPVDITERQMNATKAIPTLYKEIIIDQTHSQNLKSIKAQLLREKRPAY